MADGRALPKRAQSSQKSARLSGINTLAGEVRPSRRHPRKSIDTDFEAEFSVGSYLAYQGDRLLNRSVGANSYVTLAPNNGPLRPRDEPPRSGVPSAAGCAWLFRGDVAERRVQQRDHAERRVRPRLKGVVLRHYERRQRLGAALGVAAGAGLCSASACRWIAGSDLDLSRTIVVRHEVHEAVAQIADAVEEEHRVHAWLRPRATPARCG